MITRKQYLAGESTHDEYYDQFVDSSVTSRVVQLFGRDYITKSTDPHFNDSPLTKWDLALKPFPKHIGDRLREAGTFPTLSDAVCIAKAAARQIRGH